MNEIELDSIGPRFVPRASKISPATPVQEKGRVLSNQRVSSEHNLLTVSLPKIGHRACAGQFVQIRVPDGSVFLPRPFSFLSASQVRCMFLSRIVGSGTLALSKIIPGQELQVIGPLGNGFDLSGIVDGGNEVILVGGGVGIPPLIHAAQELSPITGTAFIGASRSDFLLCTDMLSGLGWKIEYATDDGSHGYRGLVTDLLDNHLANYMKRFHKYSGAFKKAAVSVATDHTSFSDGGYSKISVLSCGPHPMLKQCAQSVERPGISCQVALEQVMACGFGVCLGCAVRIKVPNKYDDVGSNYALVCSDGPVFKSDHVYW